MKVAMREPDRLISDCDNTVQVAALAEPPRRQCVQFRLDGDLACGVVEPEPEPEFVRDMGDRQDTRHE